MELYRHQQYPDGPPQAYTPQYYPPPPDAAQIPMVDYSSYRPIDGAPSYHANKPYVPVSQTEIFTKGAGTAAGAGSATARRFGWWYALTQRTRYIIMASVFLGLVIIIAAGAGVAVHKNATSSGSVGSGGSSGSGSGSGSGGSSSGGGGSGGGSSGCHSDYGDYCADDFGCIGVCFGSRCQC